MVLLDPCLDTAVEDQAIARVHRIGQTRNVRIVRFVTKFSVEQRMLELQEAKRALSRGALAKLSADELKRTRLRDLCKLFDGFDAGLAERRAQADAELQLRGGGHVDEAGLEEARRALPPLIVD